MAGPWEKYQKQTSVGKPWEKYQAQTPTPPAPEEQAPPTDLGQVAESGLQGFGQGATLGYLPQLQAAAAPALAKAYDYVKGTNVSEDMPDYVTRRDQFIDLQKKLQARNPVAYGGGQVAGTLNTALITPGMGLAKGATLGEQTARALQTGVAIRGLQNPGDVQGEVSPLQLGERVENATNPMGLAFDAAIPGVAPALGAVKNKLSALAERSAFKSLGPYARQAMQAFGKGKVNEIGRTALDTGLVGGIPKSYGALEQNASTLKDASGENLNRALENMASSAEAQGVGVSRKEISDSLRKEVINPNTDIPGVLDRNAKFESYINNFESSGLTAEEKALGNKDNIPLLEAEMKKRAVGKEINYNRLPGADIPDAEAFNRELYSKLRSRVEQGGEDLASKTGYGVENFKALKNQYGNLSTAQDMLSKRNAKEFANRLISPSDYAAGIAGATAGAVTGNSPEEKVKHAAIGLSLGLINKGARKYGNQITATGLNTASKAAGTLGQTMELGMQDPRFVQSLQAVINSPKSTPKQKQDALNIWSKMQESK